MRRAALIAAGLGAALLALGLLQGRAHSPMASAELQRQPIGAAAPHKAAPPAAAQPPERTALPPTGPALAQGSLAGTAADGDWAWPGRGGLQPSAALRRRFDHLLSRQGELPLATLQQELARWSRAELPAAVADEVLGLWQRYLALQQHAWRSHAHPRNPQTWRPALAERQLERRRYLGAAWAAAFYGEEERELSALIVALESGRPPPETVAPELPLHPEAQRREAALQQEWQAWEQRLAAARVELQRLRSAPELAAPQREAAVARLLAERFSSAEQARARALLALDPS